MDNVIYANFRPQLEPMKIIRGQLERGINDGLKGLGFDRPDIAQAVADVCMPEIESVRARFRYTISYDPGQSDRAAAEAAINSAVQQLGTYYVEVQTNIMIALASVTQLAALMTTKMLDERNR